ncbi:hypothetical protein NFI96_019766 [Prochilodus magdalenae]|nr:hypothetical protein NFI96_019766 [Prochilodus magdalenae]
MTMSGDRTEPSAPLDLRTKSRERVGGGGGGGGGSGGGSGIGSGGGGNQGEKDSSLRGSPAATPAVRTDSDARVGIKPSPVKCASETVKPSPFKLPIRKRPLMLDPRPADPSEAEPQTDSRGNPSPAKVPRCNRSGAHNGLGTEPQTQRVTQKPSETEAHGYRPDYLQPSDPNNCIITGYRHFPSHLCTSVPLQLLEDTDRLLNEVALATRQDEDGDTALHIAVAQEKEAVVRRLTNILCWARRNLDLYNNLRQTPFFLTNGQQPHKTTTEQTPLHLAVITHQPAVVKALLQGGADPGALDRNGQNALHLCCEHGQDNCLSVILAHLTLSQCCPSAFLNSTNFEGLTPLHLAVQDGNKKMAKMLLEGGADINAVDVKSGRSPLVHAVENNCMEMVHFLIENGCNVNAQSYSGNTALHSACGRGEVEAVRVLLKNGADSSLKNYHNDTAVMVAKNKKVSDVLRGKTTRGHTLKTQHSFNGAASPNSLSHSPLATPNLHRSASLSPLASRIHSPHSQSGESMSGNQSPTESQEKDDLQRRPRTFHDMAADNRADYGMPIHSFPYFTAPRYDTLMPSVNVLPGHTYYPALQRHPYPTDTQFILLPSSLGRSEALVSHGLPTASIATQSRPSSHNSDQSDMSNMSVSSEGKGIS